MVKPLSSKDLCRVTMTRSRDDLEKRVAVEVEFRSLETTIDLMAQGGAEDMTVRRVYEAAGTPYRRFEIRITEGPVVFRHKTIRVAPDSLSKIVNLLSGITGVAFDVNTNPNRPREASKEAAQDENVFDTIDVLHSFEETPHVYRPASLIPSFRKALVCAISNPDHSDIRRTDDPIVSVIFAGKYRFSFKWGQGPRRISGLRLTSAEFHGRVEIRSIRESGDPDKIKSSRRARLAIIDGIKEEIAGFFGVFEENFVDPAPCAVVIADDPIKVEVPEKTGPTRFDYRMAIGLPYALDGLQYPRSLTWFFREVIAWGFSRDDEGPTMTEPPKDGRAQFAIGEYLFNFRRCDKNRDLELVSIKRSFGGFELHNNTLEGRATLENIFTPFKKDVGELFDLPVVPSFIIGRPEAESLFWPPVISPFEFAGRRRWSYVDHLSNILEYVSYNVYSEDFDGFGHRSHHDRFVAGRFAFYFSDLDDLSAARIDRVLFSVGSDFDDMSKCLIVIDRETLLGSKALDALFERVGVKFYSTFVKLPQQLKNLVEGEDDEPFEETVVEFHPIMIHQPINGDVAMKLRAILEYALTFHKAGVDCLEGRSGHTLDIGSYRFEIDTHPYRLSKVAYIGPTSPFRLNPDGMSNEITECDQGILEDIFIGLEGVAEKFFREDFDPAWIDDPICHTPRRNTRDARRLRAIFEYAVTNPDAPTKVILNYKETVIDVGVYSFKITSPDGVREIQQVRSGSYLVADRGEDRTVDELLDDLITGFQDVIAEFIRKKFRNNEMTPCPESLVDPPGIDEDESLRLLKLSKHIRRIFDADLDRDGVKVVDDSTIEIGNYRFEFRRSPGGVLLWGVAFYPTGYAKGGASRGLGRDGYESRLALDTALEGFQTKIGVLLPEMKTVRPSPVAAMIAEEDRKFLDDLEAVAEEYVPNIFDFPEEEEGVDRPDSFKKFLSGVLAYGLEYATCSSAVALEGSSLTVGCYRFFFAMDDVVGGSGIRYAVPVIYSITYLGNKGTFNYLRGYSDDSPIAKAFDSILSPYCGGLQDAFRRLKRIPEGVVGCVTVSRDDESTTDTPAIDHIPNTDETVEEDPKEDSVVEESYDTKVDRRCTEIRSTISKDQSREDLFFINEYGDMSLVEPFVVVFLATASRDFPREVGDGSLTRPYTFVPFLRLLLQWGLFEGNSKKFGNSTIIVGKYWFEFFRSPEIGNPEKTKTFLRHVRYYPDGRPNGDSVASFELSRDMSNGADALDQVIDGFQDRIAEMCPKAYVLPTAARPEMTIPFGRPDAPVSVINAKAIREVLSKAIADGPNHIDGFCRVNVDGEYFFEFRMLTRPGKPKKLVISRLEVYPPEDSDDDDPDVPRFVLHRGHPKDKAVLVSALSDLEDQILEILPDEIPSLFASSSITS